jgi:hypothetical protein
MKKKVPASAKEWLTEIAEAYRDAEEAISFGPAAGVNFTENELFQLAPSVCIKFRGLKRSKNNIKKATEAALSSYAATEDIPNGITATPCMSFAFCYIASHYGLELINEKEANELLQYIDAHQNQLEELIAI